MPYLIFFSLQTAVLPLTRTLLSIWLLQAAPGAEVCIMQEAAVLAAMLPVQQT
jgi:hypothetical protein